jgi:hypothetical protein
VIEFKRGKHGRCNICGKVGKLSWDHVPPKRSVAPARTEILSVGGMLKAKDKIGKAVVSQNGIKYRTLCECCNNDLLGKRCDPTLNAFALDIGRICRSGIIPPPIVRIPTKPLKLMKGIFGHLLAADTVEFDNAGCNNVMRECFLDYNAPVPDNIHVFYWLYPYEIQVIKQDLVMPARRGRFNDGFGFFKILKYFPVAYMVTNLAAYEGLAALTAHRGTRWNETLDVEIHFDKKYPWEWPDNVDPGNFIFMGAAGMEGIYGRSKGEGVSMNFPENVR